MRYLGSKTPLIPLLLAAAALAASADIYKSVDAEGRVTYSNIPMKGAKKLDLGPMPMVFETPHHARRGDAKHDSQAFSPANFPRVDAATQHSRDVNRKGILNEELSHEQSLLADAKRQLTFAPQDAKARDNVTFHEKNIEALQSEIARIK